MKKRREKAPISTDKGAPPRAPKAAAPAASSPIAKFSSAAGIVLAMVLAVLANILVARHYTRWDMTEGGSFTLSDATLATLHGLHEPVTIHVILPSSDPLRISLEGLLEGYRAETSQLSLSLVDPDGDVAEFLALRERFNLVPGRTEDGRIVADAQVIVSRGDRSNFLTSNDLIEVDDAEDMRARPRLEEALTSAIRSVTAGAPPRICFSSGHGEPDLDRGGPEGLGSLRQRLVKNNADPVAIEPFATKREADPWKDCRVMVVAAPTERVPQKDVEAMLRYLDAGGSALIAAGPQPDEDQNGYLDLGLDEVFARGGVTLRRDFIFELEPTMRSAQGFGETFTPELRPHAINEGLLRAIEGDRGLAVVTTVASSLAARADAASPVVPLLQTSEIAFGMADFLAWAKKPSEPEAKEGDTKGPLTVAFATELPKRDPNAPHGPRIVTLASSSMLFSANWQNMELRGTALFIESALSWLSAEPPNLDLPNKPTFNAGLRMSDDDLAGVFRYVVVLMPLSAALIGIAIQMRRRGSERQKGGAKSDKKAA